MDGLLLGAAGSLSLLFLSPIVAAPALVPGSEWNFARDRVPARAGWLGEGRRRRPGTRACGLCGACSRGVSSPAKASESSQSS